jgi:hypothetical protein
MPRCLSRKLSNMTRQEYMDEIRKNRRDLRDLRHTAGARIEKAFVKAGQLEANLKAQIRIFDSMRSERNIFSTNRALLPGYINAVFKPDRRLASILDGYRSDLDHATTSARRFKLCLSLMGTRKEQRKKVQDYSAMINRTMEHIALSDQWSWERRKLQLKLEEGRIDLMTQQVNMRVPGAQTAVHEYQEKPRFIDQALVLNHGYTHNFYNRCSMYICERDQAMKAAVTVERMLLITFHTLAAADHWYKTHQAGCLNMARRIFLETERHQTK